MVLRIAMVQVVTKPFGDWVDVGLVAIDFGLVGPLPPGVLAESRLERDWPEELVALGVLGVACRTCRLLICRDPGQSRFRSSRIPFS